MTSSTTPRPRARGRLLTGLTAALAIILSTLVAAPAHAAGGSVSGRVLAAGSGVADVGVVLYPEGGGAYPSGQTGPDGRFTVTDVPDGDYTLRTYGSATYPSEYYDNAWSAYEAEVLTVSGGAAVTLDHDIVLEQEGAVVGTVVDEFGDPVQGAYVSFAESRYAGSYATETNADGSYDNRDGEYSDGLIPGTYWVSVWVNDEDTNHGYPYYYEETQVAVTAGATTTYDIVLRERPTVDFTVLDPSGTPLVQAPVVFEVKRDGVWDSPQYGPNWTDENGRYRFTDSADAFRACFDAPASYAGPEVDRTCWESGTTVAEATPFTVTGDQHDAYTVTLAPAPDPEPVADPVVGATPRISGRARNGATLRALPGSWGPEGVRLSYQWKADGRPIAGATGATLRVRNAFAGRRITVTVTGRAPETPAVSRTSAPTARVVGTLWSSKPRIKGRAKKGRTLRARPGSWGPGTVSLSYRWTRNGTTIKKAKSAKYRLTKRDVGKKIRVTVIGRKASYATATRTSAKTRRVKR